tara:strand:- start:1931 stop:2248 length:318 start_codon:yes stop_codon:yes gene_type:complete
MNNELKNNKHRRYNGASKSWCRVPVTALKSGSSKSFLSQSQSSFNTSSTRKTIKVFKRSFKNKYECRNFLRDLNNRYFRRFKRNIGYRRNGSLNKVEYFNKGALN